MANEKLSRLFMTNLPRNITTSSTSATPLVSRPCQSYGFSLDSDEREGEESTAKPRPGEDSRERREKPEESKRPSWEKRTPTDDKRKRREDSEPRLFMACDDNQDTQDPPESADKPGMFLIGQSAHAIVIFHIIGLATNEVSLSALCVVQTRAKPL